MSCFTSWDTGRHAFRVGTPELDFGYSQEIMGPILNYIIHGFVEQKNEILVRAPSPTRVW
jgi:hypothetical protein